MQIFKAGTWKCRDKSLILQLCNFVWYLLTEAFHYGFDTRPIFKRIKASLNLIIFFLDWLLNQG